MARSKCIRNWKNKIVSELAQDERIIEALGLNEDESADELVWNRIFPHYYIPATQESVKTYILVEINLPERRVRYGDSPYGIYTHPTIIFHVVVHQNDMQLNMAGESGTRMDYLAELIEDKYEGRLDFGVGILNLKSDLALNLNDTFRVRELIFEAVDANGVCG